MERVIHMSISLQSFTPSRTVTAAGVTLAALREQLTGRLITAASADYDEARASFMLAVDRRPLAIVRPADAQDVAAAVRFARECNIPLTVRSGGHSLGHYS